MFTVRERGNILSRNKQKYRVTKYESLSSSVVWTLLFVHDNYHQSDIKRFTRNACMLNLSSKQRETKMKCLKTILIPFA